MIIINRKSDSSDDENSIFSAFWFVLLVLDVVIGFVLLGNDMMYLLRFALVIFVLGMAALPLNGLIFGRLKCDCGYIYSGIVGLSICAYLQWLLSSLHILPFNRTVSICCVIISALVIYILFLVYSRRGDNSNESLSALFNIRYSLDIIVKWQVVFLLVFVLFTWLLAHQIMAIETERVMDYAFMLTLDKTDYMPPLDIWAAGEYINYYYFGQYLITYLCKLSFVPVSVGYSLGVSLIGTFCLLLSYSAVHSLLALRGNLCQTVCKLGGALAAFAVTLCGNFHYIVFYKLVPMFWDILQIEGEKPTYWFASSTRYIGYIPKVDSDRTITEFPSYSLIIGDLHAHFVDIMIVFTIIALLIDYAAFLASKTTEGGNIGMRDSSGNLACGSVIGKIFDRHTVFLGFILGIAAMTNYWDFPIYYVVAGSIILFFNIRRYGNNYYPYILTLIEGALIFVIATLIKLPFDLKFEKMVNGIKLCQIHSKPYQWLVLWGLPLIVLIIYILYLIRSKDKSELLNPADKFMLLIGLCGIGLTLMPEVIFVEDIYIDGYPRCNTMFKLCYEAYILLGIVMGYAITTVLADKIAESDIVKYLRLDRYKRYMSVALVVLILTGGYMITSCRMWFGEFKDWNYMGVDATSAIRKEMGREADALDWIEDNLNGREVILTTHANSYSKGALIAAMSGHPTILGWNTHEWLWHNSREFISERQADIAQIYTSPDLALVSELLNKYDVEYIYVGPEEYSDFGQIDVDKLATLGSVVYRDNEIASVIIKISR